VPPLQTAADGGYASTANLECAKALGVEDVAFHKKCRLAIEDMVKNRWVYRRVSERMCKQVSVSLPYRGDSHDNRHDDYTGTAGSTAC
jgi:hypothetical protein